MRLGTFYVIMFGLLVGWAFAGFFALAIPVAFGSVLGFVGTALLATVNMVTSLVGAKFMLDRFGEEAEREARRWWKEE